MEVYMNRFLRCTLLVTCAALTLTGCGSKETKEALKKASELEDQKQYQDANVILVNALRAREAKIRDGAPAPNDQKETDALILKVQSDPEILKMERTQIPIYLYLDRADLASAVYTDVLTGNPGDRVVYDALQSKEAKIRAGAARVLALVGKTDALGPLIQTAKDSDQDVRRAAVAALGSIKDPQAIPPLIDALKDSYWFVRSEAADALGGQKDVRAIKPLLDTVADSDSTVENSAETSLLLLCTVPKAPADEFVNRLDDPNPKISTISAVCLALMKDTRATPTLLKLVNSSDAQTRLHAVKALGELGDPTAIPTLRQTLKDSDTNVRGWSIIGLGKLKDGASVADLNAIAANDKESSDIRAAATAAVQHITGQAPAPVTNSP
jgi:HEAT repeat protein